MIHTSKGDKMSKEVVQTKKGGTRVKSLGAEIDALYALREKKRGLEAQAKEVEAEAAEIEARLMETLDAQGLAKATGSKASVSTTSTIAANVLDWDSFLAYVYKNKAGHLLQRRVSDPSWREAVELKGSVPGTEPFVKKRLNLRALP